MIIITFILIALNAVSLRAFHEEKDMIPIFPHTQTAYLHRSIHQMSSLDAPYSKRFVSCGSQVCQDGEGCCLNSQNAYAGCCASNSSVCCLSPSSQDNYILGCCYASTTCCSLSKNGGYDLTSCCDSSTTCCGTGCCPTANTTCCPSDIGGCCYPQFPVCCPSYCCKSGKVCCNWPLTNPVLNTSSCCDSSTSCCAGGCCNGTQTCCMATDLSSGTCCESSATCCNGQCCTSPTSDCCDSGCCSPTNVGAIVGGTIGAIVGVLALLLLGFLIYRLCIRAKAKGAFNTTAKGKLDDKKIVAADNKRGEDY